MKRLAISLILFCFAIFVFGCGSNLSAKESGETASDFQLTDVSGKVVKLSDSKGKIIILNFFATWCPPCRMEMPDFNEIAETEADSVSVVAVNVGGESDAAIKKFADSNNLKFPVAKDDGKVSELYGPLSAIPVTYIIDKNFRIAKKYIGMRTKDVFAADVEALK